MFVEISGVSMVWYNFYSNKTIFAQKYGLHIITAVWAVFTFSFEFQVLHFSSMSVAACLQLAEQPSFSPSPSATSTSPCSLSIRLSEASHSSQFVRHFPPLLSSFPTHRPFLSHRMKCSASRFAVSPTASVSVSEAQIKIYAQDQVQRQNPPTCFEWHANRSVNVARTKTNANSWTKFSNNNSLFTHCRGAFKKFAEF